MLHYIYTPLMREEHNLPDYDGNFYFLLNKDELTELNKPIHATDCDYYFHKMFQEHCICGALDVLIREWRATHKNKTEFHYHQRRRIHPTRQIPPDPHARPQRRDGMEFYGGTVQPRESAFGVVAEMTENEAYDGPEDRIEIAEPPGTRFVETPDNGDNYTLETLEDQVDDLEDAFDD